MIGWMSSQMEVNNVEERYRPCRTCIHYDWCRGSELCNSYISKEEIHQERIERLREENERAEYYDAYNAYVADCHD